MPNKQIPRPVSEAQIAKIPSYTNRKITSAKEFLDVFSNYLTYIGYDIPTMQGFALYIGVGKDALHAVEDIYPSEYNFMRTYLENEIIKNALKENFHAGFAQFLLKNSYGYSAPDIELSTGATLTPEDRLALKEELRALRNK